MKLTVQARKENTYLELFKILNSVQGLELAKKDLEVANALYNRNIELTPTISDFKARMVFLLSKDSKKELYTKLNTSYSIFNNSLTKLRKAGLIVDNELHPYLSKLNTLKHINLEICINGTL